MLAGERKEKEKREQDNKAVGTGAGIMSEVSDLTGRIRTSSICCEPQTAYSESSMIAARPSNRGKTTISRRRTPAQSHSNCILFSPLFTPATHCSRIFLLFTQNHRCSTSLLQQSSAISRLLRDF